MYITIGRNPQSNIVVNDCNVVSYDHATIEYQNGSFLFIDDSSNGTIINGYRINHESRPIAPGDNIMLAGVFHLDWNTIISRVPNFMPPTNYFDRPTVSHISKETEFLPSGAAIQNGGWQANDGLADKNIEQKWNQAQDGESAINSENNQLDKWNWGAFLLGWIWGVFNNVYWTLLALIPIPFCALIVNIIAGVKGNRKAWENGNWKESDYQKFKDKQRRWTVAGLIVLGLSIVLSIVLFSVISAIFVSLMSEF